MSRSETKISTFTCDRCSQEETEKDFDEDKIPEFWIEVEELKVGHGRGEHDHAGELWCGRCVESFCTWFQSPPKTEAAKPEPQELHG